MRSKGWMAIFAVTGLAAVALGGVLVAGDDKGKGGEAAMSPEMEMMEKLATPGEHHKHMAAMVGKWKSASKFWMTPGAPPEESTGTMTVTEALGGRFFVSDFRGTMMGQPFQGMGFDGYDNFKQKHIGTWADTWGTVILSFEGTCSQGGKVQEMKATFDDPMTKKPSYMRTVTTNRPDGSILMEAWGPGLDGKDTKMFEITYTRM